MMKQQNVIVILTVIVTAISACTTDAVDRSVRSELETTPLPVAPATQSAAASRRIDQSAKTDAGDLDEATTEQVLGQAEREQSRVAAPATAISAGAAANSLSRQERRVADRLAAIRAPSEALDRENYAHFDDHALKRVSEHPVSTFSIDVDTGAYSNARRMLSEGRLPVQDAVRVEEFINYFSYDYAVPSRRSQPFNVITEMGPNPWNANTRLLHVGLKGYEVPKSRIPAANLVFLIDVSGSMRSDDKIGLLKNSLKILTRELRAEDRISIVVYAGATGVVLDPVSGSEKDKITAALDALSAGGRTNGAAGIRLAYTMAEQAFVEGGINRILLATDGDFNVGTTSFEALIDLVEDRRKAGISLTTLGFGTGNYNDHLMEQLADAGNGNYAYIDTLNEARKVLVEQMSATLQTIAKDVKIQIEFNPDVVAEYRLIGYENRMLAREDFNNDRVDAGEIGAGHSVTAIYEIALAGGRGHRIEPLRYQNKQAAAASRGSELAFLRLRYKAPDGESSQLIERALREADLKHDLADTSEDFRFAAAVAGFGQLLRGGKYMERFNYEDVMALANEARGQDSFGYRGEFVALVDLARSLAGPASAQIAR